MKPLVYCVDLTYFSWHNPSLVTWFLDKRKLDWRQVYCVVFGFDLQFCIYNKLEWCRSFHVVPFLSWFLFSFHYVIFILLIHIKLSIHFYFCWLKNVRKRTTNPTVTLYFKNTINYFSFRFFWLIDLNHLKQNH